MMVEFGNGSQQSTNENVSVGTINQRAFSTRLQAFYLHWRLNKHDLWGSADFLAIATPAALDALDDDVRYLKSSTFNIWLLGYEYSDTTIVFGRKQINFLCSQKKATLLETVKTTAEEAVSVDVVIHVKLKTEDGTSQMDAMLDSMHTSYSEAYAASAPVPIVGYMFKEPLIGSLLQTWADKLKRSGLRLADVTKGLSKFFAIKDPYIPIVVRKAVYETCETARPRKTISGPKKKRQFEEEKLIYRGPSAVDTEKEESQRQHQAELITQKNEETARRLASGGLYGANLNTLNEFIGCNEAKLVLADNKFEPIRLLYLYIHPVFGGPARTGALVAHANGFRYSTSTEDEGVDIMYANIKHAFFRPAYILDRIPPLLHFHLHSHIKVGNKKTKDVQFYLEDYGRVQLPGDETGLYVGPFRLEEGLNMVFRDFVNSVHDLWLQQPEFKSLGLKFEQLSTEVESFGFFGVLPYQASACIVSTSSCLVQLEWSPFLIITLSEIEIVNLERIRVGQKDFDMAIVFKDFQRDVMHISCISFELLDRIKEWLDSIEIVYFESRVNLNWRAIMKTFIDDPQAFIDVGGWEFLNREKEVFFDDGGLVSLDLEATETWCCFWDIGNYDQGKLTLEELERKASKNNDSKEEDATTQRRRKKMNPTAAMNASVNETMVKAGLLNICNFNEGKTTSKKLERKASKNNDSKEEDATTQRGKKKMNPTPARNASGNEKMVKAGLLNKCNFDEGKTTSKKLERKASNNNDSEEEDATTMTAKKKMNPTAARKKRKINEMMVKVDLSGKMWAGSDTRAPKRSRFM